MSTPRWRWRVINLIGKLPGQCWADLVTWAQDGNREAVERADSWRGALPWAPNQGCGSGPDFERNCVCYCGKVRSAEMDAQMRAGGAPSGVVR
jgi:hypothetical protein